jgi:hypothetical protein
MLLFLLGPLPGWLQQQESGTGKAMATAAATVATSDCLSLKVKAEHCQQ